MNISGKVYKNKTDSGSNVMSYVTFIKRVHQREEELQPRFQSSSKAKRCQRWARSRSLILIFQDHTGDLDLLGDLDQFQIDLDLWVIFDF